MYVKSHFAAILIGLAMQCSSRSEGQHTSRDHSYGLKEDQTGWMKEATLKQLEGSSIPDWVNVAGQPVYSPGPPGKPMADHALDNASFIAMLVCSYVDQYRDEALFKKFEPQLSHSLGFVTVGEKYLVYNDPEDPQCVYGFTDIVLKTGNLLFSSLLF